MIEADSFPSLNFLSLGAGARLFAGALGPEGATVEQAGDVVGLYTLMEKIGDGGFGSVWRAVQSEPVQREVALKIIKLGMDTLEVMGRFEQERVALAMMDHPNIAKVLDAGATPEGRPFFVMELVHGVAITQYCLEKALPLEKRLQLFKEVCGGVQHAHQKGIIHRDLKPNNILVTEVDGVPVPKIIDFGIAKAVTTEKLTEFTLVTRQEQLIGTPLYMSPEQAAGSADVDTRTDVYALGALLYELLAGKPPFDVKTLMASGYMEMRRIITDVEPSAPSKGHKMPGGRGAAASLAPIARDMDLITLKALSKDRVRRYESASALGEDVQRFLDHQPVAAHAPNVFYLSQRWVRRNRMAALAAGALLVGSSMAIWQAWVATNARHTAELARAQAERQLFDSEALANLVTDTLASMPGYGESQTIDRAELVRKVMQATRAYQGSPIRKARLLGQLAGIMARTNESTLAARKEALALAEPVLDPDDAELWRLRFNVSEAEADAAPTRPQGLAGMRAAYEWFKIHMGPKDQWTLHVGMALGDRCTPVDPQGAVKTLAEVSGIMAKDPGNYRTGERIFTVLAYCHALMVVGNGEEALKLSRENIQAAETELGPADFEAARAFQTHAEICMNQHLLDEAAAAAHKALTRFFSCTGPLGSLSIATQELLLAIESERKDTGALLATHKEILDVYEKRLGPSHPSTAKRLKAYSRALVQAGRAEEADKLDTGWLQRVRQPDGTLTPPCEEILRGHIEALRATSQWERAAAALTEAIAMCVKLRPNDEQRWGDMSNLGDVLIKQGRKAEAVPLLKQAVAALENCRTRVRVLHYQQAKQRLALAQQ